MHKKAVLNRISNYTDKLVFLAFLLLSFFTIEEFGISWDENIQKNIGYVNFDYIFYDNDTLLSLRDKDYGAFFELILVFIEKQFSFDSLREVFLLRHFLTHLFFLVSACYLYRLILFLYNNKTLALMGMLFLLLTPRLYAHSFFNTKDLPFLSMLIIVLYQKAVSFERRTIISFLSLGLLVGFLTSIRLMGVIFVAMVPLYLLLDTLSKRQYKSGLFKMLSFIIGFCSALYISWPYLWSSPILNFLQAFKNMSEFRWVGTLLFKGDLIPATEIGWAYIPTWFSITTPIVFLCLGILGIGSLIYRIVSSPKSFLFNSKERNMLSCLIIFLGSIITVIVLKSVLYDGWRQMYYIYPAFILIAISFIYSVKHQYAKRSIYFLLLITFIYEFGQISIHTTQSTVYFNSLLSFKKGDYLSRNYEMDYWGNTYKKTLEMLAEKVEGDSISLHFTNPPGEMNLLFLRKEDRSRFNVKGKEEAMFLVTNFRYKNKNYSDLADKEYLSLKYGENKVCSVFKLTE